MSARLYAELPGGLGLVRVERITYPSVGAKRQPGKPAPEHTPACLCRVLTLEGELVPELPPVRIEARKLIRG